ncbi:hypothetical protein HA402_007833 [Bradysia odoriphaga]|nr:hypothetical protein HA402_007833 [Bradysia odoriphaga]
MSQFSLRWNNYINHITYAFESLRSHEDLVDVTLCCEGRKIRAHKILLSACSTYFKDVFKENPCQHPVIIFKNVKYEDLLAIIEFMYQGEVNVQQESLSSFLNTAEMLAVQGLTDTTNPDTLIVKDNITSENLAPTFKNSKHQSDIKSVSMTTQTYPIVTQTQTSEFTTANIVIKSRTFSEKTDNTDFTLTKKRRISHDPVEDDDQQNVVDEDIYEECGDADGDLQQTDNVMNHEAPSHFLKVELPEYLEHEAESSQTKQAVSIADQSSESLTKYKQLEDDNEIDIIYQDSESEQRDASEMERLYTTQESADGTHAIPGGAQAKQYQTSTLLCDLCHRKFTSVSALKRHKESKHTETRITYTCQQCGKLFKTKWSLSTHTSRFHRNKSLVLIAKDDMDVDLNELKTEYLR